MSGFIRTIERTATRVLKHRKGRHYKGRGQQLGIQNPRDPCLVPMKDRKRAKTKVWRSKANAPTLKPKLVSQPGLVSKRISIEARARFYPAVMIGAPAALNRETEKPHEHRREKARRVRQAQAREAI